MEPQRDGARPVGRRLFLALMGLGAAGLAGLRWRFREDDASAGTVAEEVAPVTVGIPPEEEPLIGVHPNIVGERFRYYSVTDIPHPDPRTWQLDVDGEGAGTQLHLRLADLERMRPLALKATFRCVTGWRVRDCVWQGVRLSDVLDLAQPTARAGFVTFYSSDGVYTESLTMAQARSPRAMLAWLLNGQPLIPEQGHPLRLIFPDLFGYKNIKWLRRIELKSHRDIGFWSQRGWDQDGYVYNPSDNS